MQRPKEEDYEISNSNSTEQSEAEYLAQRLAIKHNYTKALEAYCDKLEKRIAELEADNNSYTYPPKLI